MLYQYPDTAKFDKIIAKDKLCESIQANSKNRTIIQQQIKQIRWLYKIAESTANTLTKTDMIPEIQVIQITLRQQDIPLDILRAMDKYMTPTVFECVYGDTVKICATHKTQSKNNQWHLHEKYVTSSWLNINTDRQALPNAQTLEQLYYQILGSLLCQHIPNIDLQNITAHTITTHMDKIAENEKIQKQIQRLESKKNREQQLNKKIKLAEQINDLKNKLL